jgi:hypothetical protein
MMDNNTAKGFYAFLKQIISLISLPREFPFLKPELLEISLAL